MNGRNIPARPARMDSRYASFESDAGEDFSSGGLALEALAAMAKKFGEPEAATGQQELMENLVKDHIFRGA